MSNSTTMFVGLDVHKDSISVACAPEERTADVACVFRTMVNGRFGRW